MKIQKATGECPVGKIKDGHNFLYNGVEYCRVGENAFDDFECNIDCFNLATGLVEQIEDDVEVDPLGPYASAGSREPQNPAMVRLSDLGDGEPFDVPEFGGLMIKLDAWKDDHILIANVEFGVSRWAHPNLLVRPEPDAKVTRGRANRTGKVEF